MDCNNNGLRAHEDCARRGFKALKQLVKLYFAAKQYDKMMESYKRVVCLAAWRTDLKGYDNSQSNEQALLRCNSPQYFCLAWLMLMHTCISHWQVCQSVAGGGGGGRP
jgi:hypothetical protein